LQGVIIKDNLVAEGGCVKRLLHQSGKTKLTLLPQPINQNQEIKIIWSTKIFTLAQGSLNKILFRICKIHHIIANHIMYRKSL
jgi:hypothetical protein